MSGMVHAVELELTGDLIHIMINELVGHRVAGSWPGNVQQNCF